VNKIFNNPISEEVVKLEWRHLGILGAGMIVSKSRTHRNSEPQFLPSKRQNENGVAPMSKMVPLLCRLVRSVQSYLISFCFFQKRKLAYCVSVKLFSVTLQKEIKLFANNMMCGDKCAWDIYRLREMFEIDPCIQYPRVTQRANFKQQCVSPKLSGDLKVHVNVIPLS